MEQRRFGNSGLSVSVLSFGTMTVGGKDRFSKMGNLGVSETKRILDVCRDAGVTTIDTADVYSHGASEEIIGEALQGRRDDFVLVTKSFMRLGTTGPHDTGLSRKYLIKACEASLKRLQTDYIDLYISHEPDMFVPLEETMRAYDDLVTSGQGALRWLFEQLRLAGHEVDRRIGTSRTDALHLPAGQLQPDRSRRRARDHSARPRSGHRADGVESAPRRACSPASSVVTRRDHR